MFSIIASIFMICFSIIAVIAEVKEEEKKEIFYNSFSIISAIFASVMANLVNYGLITFNVGQGGWLIFAVIIAIIGLGVNWIEEQLHVTFYPMISIVINLLAIIATIIIAMN